MKRYIQFSLVLMSLSLLTIIGCREDMLIDEEPPIINPTTEPGEFYSTELSGFVKDVDGTALANASVIVDGNTFTTNEFGLFSASEVDAPSTGLYIKVLKEGYYTGGTHYFPQSVSDAGVEVTLLAQDTRNFDASEGYTVELPSGASVTIPAAGLQRDGEDYSGTVNISSVWLNPQDEETFNTMPGALIAQDEEGEIQMLQTFGMIAVEMRDDAGRALQLKEGSLAELTFPLDDLASATPESIALWHFDETKGIWIEEGQAVKNNGQYTAQVEHFTWWNCDVPYDLTKLCLDIVDQNGASIENLTACLSSSNSLLNFCNPSNQYCGLVPTGQNLELQLKDICNEVVHTESVGPFDGTINDVTNLTVTVTLPSYASLTFTGTATDCDGDALADNGVVSLTIDGNTFYDFSVDNGAYDINLINCTASATEATLYAVDTDALEAAATTINLVSGQNDYSTDISACGQALSELVTIESANGQIVTEDVAAYQTVAETLIAIEDNVTSNTVTYIGFKGFAEGTFMGNIFSPLENTGAQQGLVDQATIVITRYDDVGGVIVGSFSEGSLSGDFIVTRER